VIEFSGGSERSLMCMFMIGLKVVIKILWVMYKYQTFSRNVLLPFSHTVKSQENVIFIFSVLRITKMEMLQNFEVMIDNIKYCLSTVV
jgi:hypothetical protein